MRSFPVDPSIPVRRERRSSAAAMAFAALALFSLPALTGCPPNRLPGEEEDPDLGDNNPVPTGSLTVTPPDTTVALKGNDVTIALRAASKDFGDVTAAANWSVSDNSIGAIVGGKLTVRGALLLPVREYELLLGVRRGQPFNRSRVAEGLEKIRILHRERSGPPNITPITEIDRKRKAIDLTIEISN